MLAYIRFRQSLSFQRFSFILSVYFFKFSVCREYWDENIHDTTTTPYNWVTSVKLITVHFFGSLQRQFTSSYNYAQIAFKRNCSCIYNLHFKGFVGLVLVLKLSFRIYFGKRNSYFQDSIRTQKENCLETLKCLALMLCV